MDNEDQQGIKTNRTGSKENHPYLIPTNSVDERKMLQQKDAFVVDKCLYHCLFVQ